MDWTSANQEEEEATGEGRKRSGMRSEDPYHDYFQHQQHHSASAAAAQYHQHHMPPAGSSPHGHQRRAGKQSGTKESAAVTPDSAIAMSRRPKRGGGGPMYNAPPPTPMAFTSGGSVEAQNQTQRAGKLTVQACRFYPATSNGNVRHIYRYIFH